MTLLEEQAQHRERMANIAARAATQRNNAVKAAAKLREAINASVAQKHSFSCATLASSPYPPASPPVNSPPKPSASQPPPPPLPVVLLPRPQPEATPPLHPRRATSAQRLAQAVRQAQAWDLEKRPHWRQSIPSWQERKERAVEHQRQEAQRRQAALRQRTEKRAAEQRQQEERRHRAARERNLELVAAWEAAEAAETSVQASAQTSPPSSPCDVPESRPRPKVRPQTAGARSSSSGSDGSVCGSSSSSGSSSSGGSSSGAGSSCCSGGQFGRGALASLLANDLLSLTRRLGGAQMATRLLTRPPPVLPLPAETLSEMRSSLKLVLHALTHNLHLEAAEGELEAARVAFHSWHATSWLDPRDSRLKPKPSSCWTVEQYGLRGFSALYAERLHLPRLAAARQVALWLLQLAPGVPADRPLAFADLGAGTSAACLGCRLALLEHAGAAQPFHAYAIDLASSGARFARAFHAMCRPSGAHGKAAALLPGQHASHYMQCDEPGIGSLASSLFEQLKQRGALQPHLLVASFSLHYLKPAEKAAFFRRLAELATAPLLLLVIKGIGEVQQLCTKGLCRSVHFGVHYVIGQDRSPRVVEGHLCLILPSPPPPTPPPPPPTAAAYTAAQHVDDEGSDAERDGGSDEPSSSRSSSSSGGGGRGPALTSATSSPHNAAPTGTGAGQHDGLPRGSAQWVLQTFDAVERRVAREGLMTGVTLFEGSIN